MARDCVPCRVGTRRILQSAVTAGRANSGGGYPLATFPDCTVLHTGEFQGNSIFVVGRMTTDERLFRRNQLAEASEYAKATRQPIENLPTTALCDAAVLSVLATVQ